MRRCNVWIFYVSMIVASFLFFVRFVQAEAFGAFNSQLSNFHFSTYFPTANCSGLTPAQCVAVAVNQSIWDTSTVTFSGVIDGTVTIGGVVTRRSDSVTFAATGSIINMVLTCVSPEVAQPNGTCAAPCAAPGDYAGEAMTQAGYGTRPICAPDLCYYNVANSITSGEAAEPPNVQTLSWLGDATGATCTAVDGAGAGGCPAGQADLGFGCMTFADNQAAFDAVNHLGAYVDPCIAAGTCTSLIDPCIGAGTCVGTGTGVGGTAGSGGTGVGGSTYVDPCIAAGTCTPAADPCIAAGTCTGTGTGTGGTAGGVNPCIAAGTCAGSGTGTGSGTGSATESTLRSVLDTLSGLGDFGSVSDVDLGTKTVNVAITPVSVGTGGACPGPSPMVLHGQTYYFEWTTYCNFAAGIKPILLVFAWLSAAGILIGGFKAA